MKRYCIPGDYKAKRIFKERTDIYFDVNYSRLLEKIKTQRNNKKAYAGDWEFCLDYVFNTYECKFDILNDITMILIMLEDCKEELFLNPPLKVGIKKAKGKDIEWVGDLEKCNDVMKNTINNRKKENAANNDLIFDISGLDSASKDVRIKTLGSGVQRLWLSSSKFRKLFNKTESRNEKYAVDKIRKIIIQGEKDGIVYSWEDLIILEKILGIKMGEFFNRHIVDNLIEPQYDTVEPLIDVLADCEGIYSRCVVIQHVGNILGEKKRQKVKFEKEDISGLAEIMKEEVKRFNDTYTQIVREIIKKYRLLYPFETVKKIISEKKDEIVKIGRPLSFLDSSYKDKIDNWYMGMIIKEIKKRETVDKMIKFLSDLRDTEQFFNPFAMENIFPYKALWYEWDETDNLSVKIQKKIVENCYEKYNKSGDAG